MSTPVTDTYIQSGQVQRAIRRCLSNRSRSPRTSVTRIIGTITIARRVCVSRTNR